MASRRGVLKAGCRTAAYGAPLLLTLPAACEAVVDCKAGRTAASARPLRAQAAERDLFFGSAADRDTLENDPRYAEALISECAVVTPENSMKWERLRPSLSEFDFANADWLVDFAEKNGLLVHGHTLVWHLQNPRWLETGIDKANAEATLATHIDTVAGRYAGRVRSWDVVNEAIDPDAGRGDGLRPSPWLDFLGSGYIDLAFEHAAKADPGALLVYNDFGFEYEDSWYEERRRHVLDLLTGMVTRGVPINAFGIQSHLSGDLPLDFRRFERFIKDVSDLGLDIMITELDVRDHELPADPTERDCRVADTYRAYLDVVLDNPNVRSITVWGLSDRYSWLSEFEPRADWRPVRPLPLDADMNRKPAWNAISNALSERR